MRVGALIQLDKSVCHKTHATAQNFQGLLCFTDGDVHKIAHEDPSDLVSKQFQSQDSQLTKDTYLSEECLLKLTLTAREAVLDLGGTLARPPSPVIATLDGSFIGAWGATRP